MQMNYLATKQIITIPLPRREYTTIVTIAGYLNVSEKLFNVIYVYLSNGWDNGE